MKASNTNNLIPTEFRLIWGSIAIVLLLSGCVTTQGAGSDGQPNLFQSLASFNPFDTVGGEFRKLIEEKKFEDAHRLFNTQYAAYFKKRFVDEKSPITPELKLLGNWYFETNLETDLNTSLSKLKAINAIGPLEAWKESESLLKAAIGARNKLQEDLLLTLTGVRAYSLTALRTEIERVQLLYQKNRAVALAQTFETVIATGNFRSFPIAYPGESISASDFIRSDTFQQSLIAKINSAPTQQQREDLTARLTTLMAPMTKTKLVDEVEIKNAREKLLADGRIDLNELPEVRELAKKYGESSEFANFVKIGYVDLTATSFRNRNVFDFEVAFDRDYGISFQDAKDDLLGSSGIAKYDFVFVTDLSAAKIFREFKNKREESSKKKTGTRQEPNPEYVTAMSEYQRALTDMQSTKMQNAVRGSQPCYGSGFACALGAILRGASEGISEKTMKEKSALLANTPQTLTKPVYSQYAYQLVDIDLAKVARVDYYLIDVRQKKVYSSDFEIKDHEKFTVSYNVDDEDPDKSSILRNNQKEEDATNWEKKPIVVKLSDLFDVKNLATSKKQAFVTTEAFLKPLSSRKYASAAPVYSGSSDVSKDTNVDRSSTVSSQRIAHGESGAIADERFDSVVIVKNSAKVGAGFYITPDLVLTAYHVVDGGNLVELTYYDGTKTYGKVVDHDVRLDLALVRAQTAGKPVKIHSGPIKLGETAEAIGHPKGYEFTITRGVVSAIRKQASATLRSGPVVEFVQTDTPISPGNSGGPLFLKDSVIGVNDWTRVDKASQNLNFSVSFNEIKSYLNRFEGKAK